MELFWFYPKYLRVEIFPRTILAGLRIVKKSNRKLALIYSCQWAGKKKNNEAVHVLSALPSILLLRTGSWLCYC